MVNSSVSKQWLVDRYAIKAVNVHGAGAVFAKISRRFGRLGQHGPSRFGSLGITTLRGLDLDSSIDMAPSSSASQSPTEEQGDLLECTESIEYDEVFRAVITFSQKLALRLPSVLT